MTFIPFSNPQLIVLAILPKFSALLSLFASIWIILEVLSNKSKQRLVYHRILFGFAFMDLFVSSGRFLTTWPVPNPSEYVAFSMGNEKTCNFQGFLIQMSSALPIYSAMITIYFLLTIRYNFSEEKIKKNFELAFHAIPFTFGLVTSSSALYFEMFNEADLWCWIASFPKGCDKRSESDIDVELCIRGEASEAWIRYLVILPLWIIFIIIILSQVMVCRAVKVQEDRNARYTVALNVSQESSEKENRCFSLCQNIYHSLSKVRPRTQISRSQQVFSQSLFFVAMFYVIHLIPGIARVYEAVTGHKTYTLILAHGVVLPLQGFSNFVVYRRPQYVRLRKQYPNERFYILMIKSLEIKGLRICCRNPDSFSIPSLGKALDLNKILEEIKSSNDFSEHERHFALLQTILGFVNHSQPQNLEVREEQNSA
jgi:hypothetical protein